MKWIGPALFTTLALVVAALIALFELVPTGSQPPRVLGVTLTPKVTETILMIISGLTALGVAASIFVGRRFSRAGLVALALATAVSGVVYFYAQRGIARKHYAKWHDNFHYILGAKYFGEVGYFDFYDCAAEAFVESHPVWGKGNWEIRDLRTYRMIRAKVALERTDCRSKFSATRWQEFRRDIELFGKGKPIPNLLRDHGYNGSPTHTFFASKLANLLHLDYTSVTLLALVDIVALTVMFALVCLAFGPKVGFLFAILFFVNFADRFYFIGGSMMRYLWMATLCSGLAMLRSGRYRLAGVLMTTAALLNVFPLLFLVGIGVKVAWQLIRSRTLARHYIQFIAACAVTATVGLAAGASHSEGPKNYSQFLGFIGGHSQKLTSSRIGLRYTAIYRGQTTHKEPRVSYRKKARELEKATPALVIIGAALLVAGLLLCVRLDDVEAAALFGLLLFYVVFGTVEYYWAVLPVYILAFHGRIGVCRLGTGIVAATFATMACVLAIWRETQFLKFCNNTVMSAAIMSLLTVAIVYFAFKTDLLSSRLRSRKALAGLFVAAAASGPALVWLFTLSFR